MSALYQRKDCEFCQYYDSKHDTSRCHCAACWRRRSHTCPSTTTAPSCKDQNPVDYEATTIAPVGNSKDGCAERCVHAAVPFHQCKHCVLPPYFQHPKTQWDGHAVVCAPNYVQRKGCGCAPTCECRQRGARESARAYLRANPLPQYAAHEVPIMGPRAALYTKH